MRKDNLSKVEITRDGMVKIDYKDMGWHQRLSNIRKVHGLTQVEAAKMCLTNHKNYWQWEKGKIKPSNENQEVIALAFGVTVSWLFS